MCTIPVLIVNYNYNSLLYTNTYPYKAMADFWFVI